MKVEFHPEAAQELAAAVKFGEDQDPGLGGQLLEEARRVAAPEADGTRAVVGQQPE